MRKILRMSLFSILLFVSSIFAQQANHLVIAEIYGGGGNSGATFRQDYILLFNPTSSAIDVSTWSVQYATSTGDSWNVTNLSGIIPANSYYLIQEATGSGGTEDIPTPDAIGTKNLNATKGKVALVNSTTALSGAAEHSAVSVVDYIGYGTATDYEGTGAAPAGSNTTSVCRKGWDGSTAQEAFKGPYGNAYDTDDNSNDFYTRDPSSSELPAELFSFSAYSTENSVILKWQTATEVNNYGFDVERKQGNKSWNKIGFVAGSGNSNSPKSYSFTDRPTGGTTFSYRLKQIDVDGTFKYYDAVTVSLKGSREAKLLQNSPNPFNPSTAIKFYIPSDSRVKIVIYDILGREVTTLLNEQKQAGYHIVYWNGTDKNGIASASGVYLYRLAVGSYVETKKMNLLK